jgi:hypothetical protein
MYNPIGFFDKLEKRLPSNNIPVLIKLKDSRISKMMRYSWWPSEESAVECEISLSSVFCLTAGPILFTLESGLVIGFGSQPELASTIVWIEETEDGKRDEEITTVNAPDLYPVEACDSTYSEETICQLIGKNIVAIKILQRDTDNSRIQGLPREYGVVLEFDNGSELVMSHGLHDNSDDFSVIFRNQIQQDIVKDLREMIVI